MFENLKSITFMSSEGCNLNCKYCEIAKNSTNSHFDEAEKVRQALKDGSYLARYEYFFRKYNINPRNIERIELWGQEPTLTLNEFSSQLKEVLNFFPRTTKFFFSTNGVAYVDRLINFVNTLNSCINDIKSDDNPDPFEFTLQFSFDGIEHTKTKRGVQFDIIYNNVKQFLQELNNINISKKIQICLQFHGVLTFDIMRDGLKNGIENYWEEIDKIMGELYSLSTNKQVFIDKVYTLGIQLPYNATKEEGEILAKYIRYCSTIPFKNLKFNMLHPTGTIRLYTGLAKDFANKEKFLTDMQQIANYDYGDNEDNLEYLNRAIGCGAGYGDIKMRYNGQIIYCQNIIYNLREEDFNDKKIGAEYDIQKLQMKKNIFPNVLSDSEEEVQRFINIFDSNSHFSFPFVQSLYVNYILFLLKNNQISESYKNNYEKILRHAAFLTKINSCWYNQFVETGTFYSKSLGCIRYFCNGLLDLVEELVEKELE